MYYDDRLLRDTDTRVLQRHALKELIDSVKIENEDLSEQVVAIQTAVDSLAATSKTDDLAMRDKLGSLRAQLADEEAKNSLEMKEIKSKYNSKLQVIAN